MLLPNRQEARITGMADGHTTLGVVAEFSIKSLKLEECAALQPASSCSCRGSSGWDPFRLASTGTCQARTRLEGGNSTGMTRRRPPQ